MKRQFIILLIVAARYSCAAAASLSVADIHDAVEEAAKQYLGDFPPYGIIRTGIAERFSAVTCGPALDHVLADGFPGSQVSLSLRVTRPAASEMLIERPSYIELFASP